MAVLALLVGIAWYMNRGPADAGAAGAIRTPTGAQLEKIKGEKGIKVSQAELKAMKPATVERVVDGDTLEASVSGRKVKVRLLNVNTPETVDPRRPVQTYGKEASDFTKSMLPKGTKIFYRYDVEKQDRYQRELWHVYLEDGTWFNALLIRAGYAQVMTISPNVGAADFFKKLQATARQEGIGLWQLPEYRKSK